MFLLSKLLDHNDMLVSQGELTRVRLTHDLAEGENLGSLLYQLIPNVLANELDRRDIRLTVAPDYESDGSL